MRKQWQEWKFENDEQDLGISDQRLVGRCLTIMSSRAIDKSKFARQTRTVL